MSEQNDNSNNVNTKNITLVIGVITFLVFAVYICYHKHLAISDNTASWGTFGDYIGGVLNPTIAFFAFYLIAKTYDLQKQELKETRNLLNISTEAQIKQVKLAALTALLNTKLMHIDGLKTQIIAWQAEKSNILVSRNTEEQASNAERKSLLESWIKTNNDKIKTIMNEVTTLENDIKAIGGL